MAMQAMSEVLGGSEYPGILLADNAVAIQP
jgi:hypothetical protein